MEVREVGADGVRPSVSESCRAAHVCVRAHARACVYTALEVCGTACNFNTPSMELWRVVSHAYKPSASQSQ